MVLLTPLLRQWLVKEVYDALTDTTTSSSTKRKRRREGGGGSHRLRKRLRSAIFCLLKERMKDCEGWRGRKSSRSSSSSSFFSSACSRDDDGGCRGGSGSSLRCSDAALCFLRDAVVWSLLSIPSQFSTTYYSVEEKNNESRQVEDEEEEEEEHEDPVVVFVPTTAPATTSTTPSSSHSMFDDVRSKESRLSHLTRLFYPHEALEKEEPPPPPHEDKEDVDIILRDLKSGHSSPASYSSSQGNSALVSLFSTFVLDWRATTPVAQNSNGHSSTEEEGTGRRGGNRTAAPPLHPSTMSYRVGALDKAWDSLHIILFNAYHTLLLEATKVGERRRASRGRGERNIMVDEEAMAVRQCSWTCTRVSTTAFLIQPALLFLITQHSHSIEVLYWRDTVCAPDLSGGLGKPWSCSQMFSSGVFSPTLMMGSDLSSSSSRPMRSVYTPLRFAQHHTAWLSIACRHSLLNGILLLALLWVEVLFYPAQRQSPPQQLLRSLHGGGLGRGRGAAGVAWMKRRKGIEEEEADKEEDLGEPTSSPRFGYQQEFSPQGSIHHGRGRKERTKNTISITASRAHERGRRRRRNRWCMMWGGGSHYHHRRSSRRSSSDGEEEEESWVGDGHEGGGNIGGRWSNISRHGLLGPPSSSSLTDWPRLYSLRARHLPAFRHVVHGWLHAMHELGLEVKGRRLKGVETFLSLRSAYQKRTQRKSMTDQSFSSSLYDDDGGRGGEERRGVEAEDENEAEGMFWRGASSSLREPPPPHRRYTYSMFHPPTSSGKKNRWKEEYAQNGEWRGGEGRAGGGEHQHGSGFSTRDIHPQDLERLYDAASMPPLDCVLPFGSCVISAESSSRLLPLWLGSGAAYAALRQAAGGSSGGAIPYLANATSDSSSIHGMIKTVRLLRHAARAPMPRVIPSTKWIHKLVRPSSSSASSTSGAPYRKKQIMRIRVPTFRVEVPQSSSSSSSSTTTTTSSSFPTLYSPSCALPLMYAMDEATVTEIVRLGLRMGQTTGGRLAEGVLRECMDGQLWDVCQTIPPCLMEEGNDQNEEDNDDDDEKEEEEGEEIGLGSSGRVAQDGRGRGYGGGSREQITEGYTSTMTMLRNTRCVTGRVLPYPTVRDLHQMIGYGRKRRNLATECFHWDWNEEKEGRHLFSASSTHGGASRRDSGGGGGGARSPYPLPPSLYSGRRPRYRSEGAVCAYMALIMRGGSVDDGGGEVVKGGRPSSFSLFGGRGKESGDGGEAAVVVGRRITPTAALMEVALTELSLPSSSQENSSPGMVKMKKGLPLATPPSPSPSPPPLLSTTLLFTGVLIDPGSFLTPNVLFAIQYFITSSQPDDEEEDHHYHSNTNNNHNGGGGFSSSSQFIPSPTNSSRSTHRRSRETTTTALAGLFLYLYELAVSTSHDDNFPSVPPPAVIHHATCPSPSSIIRMTPTRTTSRGMEDQMGRQRNPTSPTSRPNSRDGSAGGRGGGGRGMEEEEEDAVEKGEAYYFLPSTPVYLWKLIERDLLALADHLLPSLLPHSPLPPGAPLSSCCSSSYEHYDYDFTSCSARYNYGGHRNNNNNNHPDNPRPHGSTAGHRSSSILSTPSRTLLQECLLSFPLHRGERSRGRGRGGGEREEAGAGVAAVTIVEKAKSWLQQQQAREEKANNDLEEEENNDDGGGGGSGGITDWSLVGGSHINNNSGAGGKGRRGKIQKKDRESSQRGGGEYATSFWLSRTSACLGAEGDITKGGTSRGTTHPSSRRSLLYSILLCSSLTHNYVQDGGVCTGPSFLMSPTSPPSQNEGKELDSFLCSTSITTTTTSSLSFSSSAATTAKTTTTLMPPACSRNRNRNHSPRMMKRVISPSVPLLEEYALCAATFIALPPPPPPPSSSSFFSSRSSVAVVSPLYSLISPRIWRWTVLLAWYMGELGEGKRNRRGHHHLEKEENGEEAETRMVMRRRMEGQGGGATAATAGPTGAHTYSTRTHHPCSMVHSRWISPPSFSSSSLVQSWLETACRVLLLSRILSENVCSTTSTASTASSCSSSLGGAFLLSSSSTPVLHHFPRFVALQLKLWRRLQRERGNTKQKEGGETEIETMKGKKSRDRGNANEDNNSKEREKQEASHVPEVWKSACKAYDYYLHHGHYSTSSLSSPLRLSLLQMEKQEKQREEKNTRILQYNEPCLWAYVRLEKIMDAWSQEWERWSIANGGGGTGRRRTTATTTTKTTTRTASCSSFAKSERWDMGNRKDAPYAPLMDRNGASMNHRDHHHHLEEENEIDEEEEEDLLWAQTFQSFFAKERETPPGEIPGAFARPTCQESTLDGSIRKTMWRSSSNSTLHPGQQEEKEDAERRRRSSSSSFYSSSLSWSSSCGEDGSLELYAALWLLHTVLSPSEEYMRWIQVHLPRLQYTRRYGKNHYAHNAHSPSPLYHHAEFCQELFHVWKWEILKNER